jgi:hypothetical protein
MPCIGNGWERHGLVRHGQGGAVGLLHGLDDRGGYGGKRKAFLTIQSSKIVFCRNFNLPKLFYIFAKTLEIISHGTKS